MIINYNREKSILSTLEESCFEFYLTGSRFFRNSTEYSDWDFFVKNTNEVKEFLISNGFTQYSNESIYASDSMCDEVWVYGPTWSNGGLDPTFEGDIDLSSQVHVQLVKDAYMKNVIQEILLANYPNGIPKEYASSIWKSCFDVCNVYEKIINMKISSM